MTQLYPYPKYVTVKEYLDLLNKCIIDVYQDNDPSEDLMTRRHHIGDITAAVSNVVSLVESVSFHVGGVIDGNR